MIEKRWQYVNFKLGAFAEQQRKIIEEKESLVEVQIHLLASSTKADQISSYYKWNSRRNAQLTRLFNNQSDHIILLVPSDQNLDWWLDAVTAMPSNWKKPIIHIFRPVNPHLHSVCSSNNCRKTLKYISDSPRNSFPLLS